MPLSKRTQKIPIEHATAGSGRDEASETVLNGEERLRLEVSRMPIGYIVWDKDFRVVTWNPAAEKIFGFSFDEARGRHPYEMIVPPEMRAQVDDVWRRLLAGDSSAHSENENTTKDGRTITCDWTNTPLKQPDGTVLGVMSMVQDVTERKRIEKELVQKNRALRMLSAVNHALVHGSDEVSLLDQICDIVVEAGGYRLAWIGFAEQDAEKTIRPVAHVGFESGYLESLKLVWADTERGRGPSGTAIRTGKPSIARDIETDPAMAPWKEDALKRGYRSSIALPLMAGGKALGMIGIYSNEPDAFSEEEVSVLNELSDDLAFGISTLRARVDQRKAELEREQYFRFFQSAAEIMVIADPNGSFKKVNPACLRILGYTEAELLSQPFINFVHPDDRQSTLDEAARHGKSGSFNFEDRFIRKDGTVLVL